LLSQRELLTDAAVLLAAAERLRQSSGQAHRPWELRGRDLAEHMLATSQLDDARTLGEGLHFTSTIEYAARALQHVVEPV
jgi:hypothetical protein